jgi:hypothetical protein
MLLEFDPRNIKQKEALCLWADNETEEILYGGAKNGGKSYLGGSCIFHDALVYPETMYFIARQTLADLRKYTIPTIHEIFKGWGLDVSSYAKYNGQDNVFQCYNGSKVHLIECAYLPSDPLYERFGSMQMTRGWIEEVGETVEAAKQNLKLSIGRWKNDDYDLIGKLLMTCNPKKNWLKYNYIDKWKAGLLDKSKKVVLASVYDNVQRQKGSERILEELTGVMRQRLLLGSWEYDSDDDCLISGEKILDLYTNSFIEKGKRYITCDVARMGKDRSVIYVWEGWRLIHIEVLFHKKTDEVSDAIRVLQSKYQVPMSNVIADEDGIGGGVVDNLRCNGFVNNSSPLVNPKDQKKLNYDNLKSQCYYMLADRVNSGGLYVQCDLSSEFIDGKSIKEMLNQELENVRMKEIDADKKQGVLPKQKVKELIGRSPDFADTMMMREYFELAPQYEILVG